MDLPDIHECMAKARAEERARMTRWQRIREFARSLLPPYASGIPATVAKLPLYGDPDRRTRFQTIVLNVALFIRRPLNAVYYWCHYRIRRYDIVRTDLPIGYADVDTRMFFACFALLGEFVEHELGRDEDGTGHRGYRLHSQTEHGTPNPEMQAIDLWIWYLGEKANGFQSHEDDPAGVQQDALYDRRLADLIEIRRSLWT